MTSRAAVSPVIRLAAGTRATDADLVAVEAPLGVQVTQPGRQTPLPLGLLMRTPGDDVDLVTGWLVGERLVRAAADLVDVVIRQTPDGETLALTTLASGVELEERASTRATAGSSACGLCGRLEPVAVEAHAGANGGPVFPAEVLAAIPDQLRTGQAVFDQTGGLHAAGLFTAAGDLIVLREDVGRHNAVDKVVGIAWREARVPDASLVLAVSGRVAYEIVQKASAAGVGAIVAIGAPSSLAVDAARTAGMVLAGFARDGRANVYAGASRVR